MRMKQWFFLTMFAFALTAQAGSSPKENSQVEVFAPGQISRSDRIEFAAAFTPDMREVYFSVRQAPRSWTIMRSLRENGHWSDAATASFSGTWSDLEPSVSPDGRRLFFSSNRPRPGETGTTDFDVWFVDRTSSGWSEARPAGSAINNGEDQWRPVAAASGCLYYSSMGIWRATPDGDIYGIPERISDPAQPGGIVGGHGFIAPDESFLLTAWMQGPEHKGGWDLYISFRRPDGTWTPSVNLDEPVNSPANEDFPAVTPDGLFLHFFRLEKNEAGVETGDIFQVPAGLIAKLKKKAGLSDRKGKT